MVRGSVHNASVQRPTTRFACNGDVSLAYQVTSIFAGSLAPIIAIALLRATGDATAVAVYVAAAAAITLLAVYFARETRGMTFAEIDAEK